MNITSGSKLGEICLHHKATRHVCIGKLLLVLGIVRSARDILSMHEHVHLLKLVTGVEISTRPPKVTGKEGNRVKSTMRRAAAAPKSASSEAATFMRLLSWHCSVSPLSELKCYACLGARRVPGQMCPRRGVRPDSSIDSHSSWKKVVSDSASDAALLPRLSITKMPRIKKKGG